MPNPPAPATQPGYELHERLTRVRRRAGRARTRAGVALDRFLSLRSGREKPGRFWRVDFEAMVPSAATIETRRRHERAFRRSGACSSAISRRPPASTRRSSPARSATSGIADSKFGALATAFAGHGAFVYVPRRPRVRRADRDPVSRREGRGDLSVERRARRTRSARDRRSSALPPKPARSSAAPRRSSPKTTPTLPMRASRPPTIRRASSPRAPRARAATRASRGPAPSSAAKSPPATSPS